MAQILNMIMDALVAIAGFVNAGIILMQAWDLFKRKKSEGVSIKMFSFFVVFQLIFAINGWRLGDPLQMWGMIVSMICTLIVIALAAHYRKPPE